MAIYFYTDIKCTTFDNWNNKVQATQRNKHRINKFDNAEMM
jgi:hypothetical protein